jgi:outer membrane receptor protein involved in Fe transport
MAALRLTAGLSYDHLTFPANADLPPLTDAESHRSQFSPKAALDFAPWRGGHLRAAYSRSLGGLYFDNSVRLEPAQLAGFTTAFRSLIPESVAGLVPGTEFETWGVGFDQSISTGTYFGIAGEILKSNGERGVGALTNSLPIPLPDSPTMTRQELDFRERSLSAYVNQLVGRRWSFGASYRLSEAELTTVFADLPESAAGVSALNQNERAVLGQLQFSAIFNHETGCFAQWHSDFFHQTNFGYTPIRPDDAFWQHNVFVGYRFPHRRAEIRLGVLNLTDRDYRLNPLNLQSELPRSRTFMASLKLNF